MIPRRVIFLLLLGVTIHRIDAFQRLVPRRNDGFTSKTSEHRLPKKVAPYSLVHPKIQHMNFRDLSAVKGPDTDDELSTLSRLKTYAKSFVGTGSMLGGLKPIGNEDPTKTENKTDISTAMIHKAKAYIKYPYTYMSHYFRGEKQEEVDAFNDVIVSDETIHVVNTPSTPSVSTDIKDTPVVVQSTTVVPNESANIIEHEVVSTGSAVISKGPVRGNQWAVSHDSMDLTGNWTILTSDDFKEDYDLYLKLLGQPFIVRSVALSIVGMTTEETLQSDRGRTLWIKGTNARGVWERTLVASGSDESNPDGATLRSPILTIDEERVEAEAWWEDDGTTHRSWLRGVTKYGGGDFESKRYLEDGGKIFVCESAFHPNDKTRETARVTWRFLRLGEN